jgi:Mn2+/Fe2+ NRAMP family transporter
VTTAFVLHAHGITNVDSAQKAALALRPLAGPLASLLFTLGIFGVGLLAVPVLAGASAYAVAELFKWHEGLSKRFGAAKGFYWVIVASMLVGMLLNLVGINPIKALYYAAIVNGAIAPILMFFIFRIGRDKKVMGRFTSPGWVNVWGWVVTVLMGGSAVALFVFAALGK